MGMKKNDAVERVPCLHLAYSGSCHLPLATDFNVYHLLPASIGVQLQGPKYPIYICFAITLEQNKRKFLLLLFKTKILFSPSLCLDLHLPLICLDILFQKSVFYSLIFF